jgi:hypothetical protein
MYSTVYDTILDGTKKLRLRKVYRLPKAVLGPGRLAAASCLAYDFSKATFLSTITKACISIL